MVGSRRDRDTPDPGSPGRSGVDDGRRVALIRGINVGKAKRVAMSDLRKLVEDLGFAAVRTLLNSGNLVFTAAGTIPAENGSRIEEELAARTGVSARVTVLTATELATVVTDNPLLGVAGNPSRLLVAFLANPSELPRLGPLAEREWAPEALAVGSRVAYLWCPDGVLASPLHRAVSRVLGDAVTARNWATVCKLDALGRAS
jgi:uncharacterized protein (DUF1697 family)